MRSIKNITILHYRPSAKYPPVVNMVDYLTQNGVKVILICGIPSQNRAKNVFFYLAFCLRAICSLIRYKNVMVYESISSPPLLLVSLFKKLKVWFHHHEYFSEKEYQNQSFLEQFGRKCEKKGMQKWGMISHTNPKRLSMFHEEFPVILDCKLSCLINYPSIKWQKALPLEKVKGKRLKLVHWGTINFKGHYLKELLEQVGNNDNIEITFYSHFYTVEVLSFFKKYKNVIVKEAIDNKDIVSLKGMYDVGLVLYKGFSNNVIQSIPNKVYEYLALGMTVLCSDSLPLVDNLKKKEDYNILMTDYQGNNTFDDLVTFRNTNKKPKKFMKCYEEEYQKVISFFNNK